MKQHCLSARLVCLFVCLFAGASFAGTATSTDANDVLIKFTNPESAESFSAQARVGGAKVESLGDGQGSTQWIQVKFTAQQLRKTSLAELAARRDVLIVQPNYKLKIYEEYSLRDPAARARLARLVETRSLFAPPDNPEFPRNRSGGSGSDPNFGNQWGMNDIGVKNGWNRGRGQGVVVAVIDTGVDYTHEDLMDNMWHNAGESGLDSSGRDKATNGIDDDGNGFVDDLMGWDFAANDNKPYDLSVDPIQVLMGGGNPGHGTHCAGNVAASANNGKGVVGVAPEAKIMAIRFLNEKGQGDTAGAVKSINYAVKMGARILSNSWGSEGESSTEGEQNAALRETIAAAEKAGVLFVAAAGNGHSGVGYDNDTDAKPAVPASYPHENIVSVAAIASSNSLGSFSNWGAQTVDLAAPGVVVYSTTVGGTYSDTIIDMYGIKATWDGTSMACPHVAGAAAAYLSKNPGASYQQIKAALLNSVTPVPAMQGKSVSGGKLNFEKLMNQ